MTMVDPVLVASQFDEDEAEAILRYNIRKYLKANRVSQNSLMDVLNITSGAVSQLMTGRTHFKYGQVAAIANYLHVSMDDLSNATQFNEDRNFLERMKKEYTPALLFLQIGVSSRMFALQLVFRRASARNAQ